MTDDEIEQKARAAAEEYFSNNGSPKTKTRASSTSQTQPETQDQVSTDGTWWGGSKLINQDLDSLQMKADNGDQEASAALSAYSNARIFKPDMSSADENASLLARNPAPPRSPSTSIAPAINAVKGVVSKYNDKNPDSELSKFADPAVEITGGYLGGKMLRSVLPKESVYGTPEYRQEQALRDNIEPMRGAADAARETIANAGQQHQDRAAALSGNLSELHGQHTKNLQGLEQAAREHAYAQTLGTEPTQVPAQTATLTPQPRGGSGTANYAERFGATPEEARVVPSMSSMQQNNIPSQTNAWGKISNLAPDFDSFKESPLLLGSEGQLLLLPDGQ